MHWFASGSASAERIEMTVKELIEELKTRNPEQDVTVWDAMQDCETTDVHLSETTDGLLIASVEI